MEAQTTSYGMVYKVTNTATGEFYIGATKSPLNKRLKEHKRDARNGKNSEVAKAIRQYGADKFVIEAVEPARNEAHLKARETLHYLQGSMLTDKCINSFNFQPYKDISATISGAKNPSAKLTEEQALIIARIPYFLHGQKKQLASFLGVSPYVIHRILRQQGWEEAVKQAHQLKPISFDTALKLLGGLKTCLKQSI
jgi:predicted GIY-YIG superfamily endonuclease